MKKVFQLMFAAAVLCGTCVFNSCENQEDLSADEQLSQKVLGKWILTKSGGRDVLTDQKIVTTFKQTASGLKAYASVSSFVLPTMDQQDTTGQSQWKHLSEDDVNIENGKLVIVTGDTVVSRKMEHYILESAPLYLKVFTTVSMSLRGVPFGTPMEYSEVWDKVTVDYSKDIIGTWEGHSSGDQSRFDDGEPHHWEYLADGTYKYYSLNEDSVWTEVPSVFNSYFVDGYLLCTRWKNVGEGEVENREWWEIESITADTMKWIGYRQEYIFENNLMIPKQYTARFSMHKVK